jgi:hypothetical protein
LEGINDASLVLVLPLPSPLHHLPNKLVLVEFCISVEVGAVKSFWCLLKLVVALISKLGPSLLVASRF